MDRRWIFAVGLLVTLTACQRQDEPRLALGTLEWDRVELVADSSEPITGIHVVEGQRVTSGQAVMDLDIALAEARRAQLDAAVKVAQARLDEVLRGPREEHVAEAQATFKGAESRLHEAELETRRQRELVQRKLASTATLDRLIAVRDTARAERDRASESLRAAVQGSTDEEIRQARHVLEQARAALLEQQLRTDRLTIVAPRDGQVDELPFEVGDRPRTGEVVAVMLVGEGPFALAWLPEPYRASLKIGDELAIQIDGVGNAHRGQIRYLAREAAFTPYYSLSERDRSRLVYRMELTLPSALDLAPGSPLQVQLPTP